MRSLLLLLALLTFSAGCTAAAATPPPMPQPVCGGIEIAIPGAMSCEEAARRAVAVLRERAAQHIARGVTGIQVALMPCPKGEVPPQIDCTGETNVYLVTVHFNVVGDNALMEDNLTVGISPVSGRILGIANPLIR